MRSWWLALCVVASLGAASDTRRSGFDFMTPETQAIQRDDAQNPAMLWVQEGAAAWERKSGSAGRACIDCHGAASTSMKGVAARYPAFDVAARGGLTHAGLRFLHRRGRIRAGTQPSASA